MTDTMTNEKMRAEFEAWHNQRAMRLAALVESTRVKFIAAGWEDSPPTHQRALLDVVSKVDECGWDAWQAATLAERDRCLKIAKFTFMPSAAMHYIESGK